MHQALVKSKSNTWITRNDACSSSSLIQHAKAKTRCGQRDAEHTLTCAPPNPTPPRLRFARRFTAASARVATSPEITVHRMQWDRLSQRNTRGEKPTGGRRGGSRHTDLHRLAWASFLSFFPFFLLCVALQSPPVKPPGHVPRPPDHHPPQRLVSRHVRSCHVPVPPPPQLPSPSDPTSSLLRTSWVLPFQKTNSLKRGCTPRSPHRPADTDSWVQAPAGPRLSQLSQRQSRVGHGR